MIFVAAFAMYDFKPVYKYKFTRVSFLRCLTCRFLIESRSSALSLHLPETQNEYLINAKSRIAFQRNFSFKKDLFHELEKII